MRVRILIGDCREKLRELPDASVHCCVTSPPYFGLRDYGTAAWAGGDDSCDHVAGEKRYGSKSETAAGQIRGGPFRDTCGKCSATRIDRQMGLEPTPDEFVAGMVEVFREVRRVLRDDGTLWLNIGDSYAGSWGSQGHRETPATISCNSVKNHPKRASLTGSVRGFGCKPKDLIGIPWMLAFALRADGWYLRQEIIWAKPNPMPESVRDRCTKAHEQIFLLSKGPQYHFDAEAIRNPPSEALIRQVEAGYGGEDTKDFGTHRAQSASGTKARIISAARAKIKARGHDRVHEGFRDKWDALSREEQMELGSNKRSVWEVATQPYSEAHFATYPPALIEPCILAGCPKGGTVLDPFGGAGTTGLVADRLGRNAILIELNPEYAEIAERRLNADGGMFAEVKAA